MPFICVPSQLYEDFIYVGSLVTGGSDVPRELTTANRAYYDLLDNLKKYTNKKSR